MSLTTNEVPIASPCGVDWSTMTRREANKRFCDACKKHVHDLSSMDESEARALLEAPATEGLCVRYLADARGRVTFRPDVPSDRLRRASMLAVAITAPLGLTACMGAYMPPPPEPPRATAAPVTSSSAPPVAPSASSAPSSTPPLSVAAPPQNHLP